MKDIITLNQVLDSENFEEEFNVITINNDKPVSFTKKDYKVVEGIPRYTDSEKEGRSGVAVAVISPNTLAIYTSKNAETIDNLEKDQLCRFCYNIQNGVKINYYDGSDEPIEKVYNTLKTQELKKDTEKNDENNKYKNYSINVKTLTFHLFNKKCSAIQNIEPKYIQETKAFEDDIINKGFKLCKRCN